MGCDCILKRMYVMTLQDNLSKTSNKTGFQIFETQLELDNGKWTVSVPERYNVD